MVKMHQEDKENRAPKKQDRFHTYSGHPVAPIFESLRRVEESRRVMLEGFRSGIEFSNRNLATFPLREDENSSDNEVNLSLRQS